MPNETYQPEDDQKGASGIVRILAVVIVLGIVGFFGFRSLQGPELAPLAPPPPVETATPRILPERKVPAPEPLPARETPPPAPKPPRFVRPEPVGDLIAHWSFDDDGGDAVAQTPWQQAGKPQMFSGVVGQACYFGPRTSYTIDVDDAPQMSNPFTIATWIRLPWHARAGDWPSIITHGESGWRLHIDPFKRVPTLHLNDGGPKQVVRGKTQIFDGRWHHLAVVLEGRELRMYLDGQLDGSARADELMPVWATREDLVIAGHAEKGNRMLDGSLDDLRLYRAALSEEAIVELANAGNPKSTTGRWLDVIPRIKPDVHTLTGMWRKVDGELEQYGDEHANRFLRLPTVLRRSYELEVDFTRLNGENSVNLLLPVGGRGIHLMLGSHPQEGGLAGLSVVGGQAIVSSENPARKTGFLLEDGRCYGLRVRVETVFNTARIEVELDEEPFIEWEGPVKDLFVTGFPETKYPSQGILAIGCSRAITRFHKIRLRFL
jgi:hypothetical protein